MGQPVFQSRAAELAEVGLSVFRAVEPTTLVELGTPVSSALACLAFVSAARPFWDTHSLVVGYAMDSLGGDVGEPELDGFLDQRASMAAWIDDADVRSYTDRARLDTPLPVLARAADIIDAGLERGGYRAAQLTSVRILYCRRQCGDDLGCFRQCLNS